MDLILFGVIYYLNSLSSFLTFPIEFLIYGAFITAILDVVYGKRIFSNSLENLFLTTLMISLPPIFHEFDHFVIAYFKKYKPIVIPFRLFGKFGILMNLLLTILFLG